MKPKTFLVGVTEPNLKSIYAYLKYTKQEEFYPELVAEENKQLGLVSMAAKICYKSLVLGKNKNVGKIRSIQDNLRSVIDSGHGSVLEHINFNFVTTDCSRVHTHELVRHRVGVAYSQTSGRYCAIDEDSEIVLDDPILEEYRVDYDDRVASKYHGDESLKGVLQIMFDNLKKDLIHIDNQLREKYPKLPFDIKKKITSALRRIAPNGAANEIVWSMNLRQLRHTIQMRTNPAAEWEINYIFKEVVELIKEQDPMYLYGGEEQEDGSWKNLAV